MYKLNETIDISVSRDDANFDRACDSALAYALTLFGANDNGYLAKVIGSERSRDSIEMKFTRYSVSAGMGGQRHYYQFTAKVIDDTEGTSDGEHSTET